MTDHKGESRRVREQQQVLSLLGRLLAENENLKAIVLAMADRIAAQSDLLARLSERLDDPQPTLETR